MQEKNHVYFVAVILKVLLDNLLGALNFADVFLNRKTFEKIEKTLKTFLERFFCIYAVQQTACVWKSIDQQQQQS